MVTRTLATAPSAVILCAGASRRMGTPKGLLDLGGVPLLRAHVDAFAAAGLDTTVVLGPHAAAHLAVLPAGTRVVLNLRWDRTEMADSAAMGLVDLGDVLLTPVDAPPAAPETLRRLLAVEGTAVPAWDGRDGHPVRLAAPHPPGRLDARLAGAVRVPVEDPDCVANLNRPEDWEAFVRAWTAKRPRCR